ncbi:zinc finger CCCH domain-containing protein 11A-like [Xiphophorus maculatus]|uniref:Zinc finger CCCH-type containing 11A n=1 Tax=Xiphophorus maculatus TaxID=8083 RepID=M3ZRB7_XIPMA|nr:zinc finger CCCH domain-containing protein 11A-like [Xiphophorus maculatus]XP_023180662.1 zinc finger CCCH domain-containing protein 11A-like [Xiphophorus maculatus]XP_023180663.1 zinc finger CCCH domain-containing protein 11A-like [Xiphophorus maculatus]XP_023180664.1 zinc finger CCCH domain-containing protein 11A-like [Xiphophorus maculatus]
MTNHGDDCYFFYYSTCSKGDSCPFRHCEAAMGNETVCNLWQEGRCFRTVCKFRHMKITKNRKEIPCYWENQPAGCQKPHCAFFHERPRYVEGVFVPPDKVLIKSEEPPHEEPAPPPAAAPPNAANPQLRGVIKTDTQEAVPSPTHPPVVINPADDDEDEEDQFSEEGEDGKVGPSPRKMARSGEPLNFGVSTLEEIRLRKALKSSMRRAGYPLQSADTSTNGEKENCLASYRPAHSQFGGAVVFEEPERPRGRVAERLGQRAPPADFQSGGQITIKKSLAERLGRIVDEEEPPVNTQKALKPIKERLGLVPPIRGAHAAEANPVSTKAPDRIRIKTLEEIRQAKAGSQKDVPAADAAETTKTELVRAAKATKRSITLTDAAIGHVKTFSEIIREKKMKQEEEQNQNPNPMKAELPEEKAPAKGPGPTDAADVEKVRVKTLEEIRREKAARVQAQQTTDSPDPEHSAPKRPHLLRVKKSPTQQSNTAAERSAEPTERPAKAAASPAQASDIKVKTFEEIMQEKRLRRQEQEGQAKSPAEADSSQKQSASSTLKRKTPATTCQSPAEPPPASRVSIRKLVSLKPRAPSPPKRTASPGPKTVAMAMALSDSPTQSSTDFLDKTKRGTVSQPSALITRESSQPAELPADSNQTKTLEHPGSCKVRPKLNVKPSVVKPAGQVKPPPKKRGVEGSAVAAVKPMNSSTAAQQSSNKEVQPISAVPPTPSTQRDELQTVPVFTQIQGQDIKAGASGDAVRDTWPVPQSPVVRSPTQPRARRSSAAASRTASTSNPDASGSSVDDFEDLINQFTDDHLEGDVDPAIGEDDLLQELSEMIDS